MAAEEGDAVAVEEGDAVVAEEDVVADHGDSMQHSPAPTGSEDEHHSMDIHADAPFFKK